MGVFFLFCCKSRSPILLSRIYLSETPIFQYIWGEKEVLIDLKL